ncbi:hypothetical protein ACTXGQ_14655 [Marinobacter sp. 1Y8]
MAAVIEWLDHWQTMFGSILGGLIAIMAALIVAQAQTRRERRTAAMLVFSDLLAVVTVSRTLRALSVDENLPEEEYPRWVAGQLLLRRPKISPHFEAEMVRLLNVHTSLAAHLHLFRVCFSIVEDRIRGLDDTFKEGSVVIPKAIEKPSLRTTADFTSIATELDRAAHHADYAIHYLEKLVLSNTPTLSRLRMALYRCPVEKKSSEMLATGKI